MAITTWVKRLLIANVAMFFITAAVPWLWQQLVLVPALALYRPWTLVSYMFLHGGFMHLLFNMIGLFFFGPRLEIQLGSRDFLLLYFLSGIGGAVLSFFFTPMTPIVGASGGVFGILLAYAMYWPRERIYLLFPPIPIEARWLVIGLTALSLYSGFTGVGGRIAHFAHLGGFAAAWLFLRWRRRRKAKMGPTARQRATRVMSRVSGQDKRQEEEWRSIRLDGLHEINRAEVERILNKVRESGVHSLTREEREFMDRMSQFR